MFHPLGPSQLEVTQHAPSLPDVSSEIVIPVSRHKWIRTYADPLGRVRCEVGIRQASQLQLSYPCQMRHSRLGYNGL
jgi:hypothetical protein